MASSTQINRAMPMLDSRSDEGDSARAAQQSRGGVVPGNTEDFAVIKRPYLAVLNSPYFIDGAGQVLLDRSWHHDLVRHLDYIAAFTLAAPLRPLPADTTELVPLAEAHWARVRLIALPSQSSRLRALAQLPATIRAIWRAIGLAEIVHVG